MTEQEFELAKLEVRQFKGSMTKWLAADFEDAVALNVLANSDQIMNKYVQGRKLMPQSFKLVGERLLFASHGHSMRRRSTNLRTITRNSGFYSIKTQKNCSWITVSHLIDGKSFMQSMRRSQAIRGNGRWFILSTLYGQNDG